MNNLATYLPQDRRRALARGENLPSRAYGSVLFADISGFTPFTEALRHAYGSRRGAEELTNHLNTVYTALIAEVERYGGSVTSFSGDAITCWFGDRDDGQGTGDEGQGTGDEGRGTGDEGRGTGDEGRGTAVRAVACAVALQTVMAAFAEIVLPNGETGRLTIKIGIATGVVRRLVVGAKVGAKNFSPQHYWLDVLAGETVNRTAVAEQLATAPDILLDEPTITPLGQAISLSEWRTSDETGERFGVLEDFVGVVDVPAMEPLPELGEEVIRPWLNPLVYEREKTGHALLQTDFRPCVALFVRFVGIDDDADTAADQLNQLIHPLQAILVRYQGTLIDLTFGDKGSYAYINFGALSLHEDDARRAAKTALELQDMAHTLPFLRPLQIGITYGVMRTGAYGGPSRRHYGALGDEVNVAARLMQTAAPGQILVSGRIQKQLAQRFHLGAGQQVRLKGKQEPLSVFPLYGEREPHPLHLPEPSYNTPLVGREAELNIMAARLQQAGQGQAQIVALVGEAGLGKSRLAMQAVQLGFQQGFISYGGACQADGQNTPYWAWKQVWRSFFGLELHHSPVEQLHLVTAEVRRYAPQREPALPLLGRLLDLPIPENEFTKGLEPKNRQMALHALWEDCLRQASRSAPRLLVLEDLHWVDALSYELLVELVQALDEAPLLFLLAYRQTDWPPLQTRPNFTPLVLSALNETEAKYLIQAKLPQLYASAEGEVSATVVQTLLARAQGNPFYLEELLNFLHGRGLDLHQAAQWETELPDSLHALILSRLDQLADSQKRTIRVASIIGRWFPVSWLVGYYPTLGDPSHVQADLNTLHALDLTLLDSHEPEPTYLFKHIITHEVTYESLPFATRARLHEQLAHYLEATGAPLDTIAHHYGQSDNRAKQRVYFRQAAEAAQRNYANEAALAYYDKLLPLLTADEQAQIYLQRGQVQMALGNFAQAEEDYQRALPLAPHASLRADILFALGKLNRQRGDDYEAALTWLTQAGVCYAKLGDSVGQARVLVEKGGTWYRRGAYTEAQAILTEALPVVRAAGDKATMAQVLNYLGVIAIYQGDYEAGWELCQESYGLWCVLGDKTHIASLLSSLASVPSYRGDYPATWALLEESQQLWLATGSKYGVAITLANLSYVRMMQGEYEEARTLAEESLVLAKQAGSKWVIPTPLTNLVYLDYMAGDYAHAQELLATVWALYSETGAQWGMAYVLPVMGLVAWAEGDIAAARDHYSASLALAHQIGSHTMMANGLLGLGLLDLAEEDPALLKSARQRIGESLRLRGELGEWHMQTSSLIGVAGLVLREGNPRCAAYMLGVVDGALRGLGAAVEIPLLRFHAETVAAGQARLTPAEWAAAWEQGVAMPLEDALRYTLDKVITHD